MIEKLKNHVEKTFEDVPKTGKAHELKEELISNLTDRYNDAKDSGKTEDEAYRIAISSIGDIDELARGLKENDVFSINNAMESRKASAIRVSIAVMLYIISVLPVIIIEEFTNYGEATGVVFMFLIIAAATGILVYNGITKPKYSKGDNTLVEEFKEWKSSNDNSRLLLKTVISTTWSIILVIYFVISFMFGAWAYSWIIFIIGAAVTNIIKIYFELRRG